MDILISFVGKQDPISERTNEEGAVLTLCRHIRPAVIYLLPSAEGVGLPDSTEEHARMTREFLREVLEDCKCYIRPLAIADPTDFRELLPKVKNEVSRILEELRRAGEEFRLHLNCSSGTPQMTACWYVLANSGHIPGARLWQAHDPSKVKGDRVRELELNFLEEENIVHRLRRCLPEYLFGVMAEECRRLAEVSVYSARRAAAEAAAEIFRAYNLWDLLQYRMACDKLASVERRWRQTVDAGEVAGFLREQVECLRKLAHENEKETPENLVDIYFNAGRCFARKAYTDTVARFRRLYEGTVYYLLREKYGVSPRGNLSDPLSLAKAVEHLRKRQDGEFIRVLKVPVSACRSGAPQTLTLGELLEELRKKRNLSVAGHGMKPVTEEDARNSLEAGRHLIEVLLPGARELLNCYPLQRHAVEALVEFLART